MKFDLYFGEADILQRTMQKITYRNSSLELLTEMDC